MLKRLTFIFLLILINLISTGICEAKSARANYREYYKTTIKTARETLWNLITSGRGGCATIAVMDGGRIVYSEGIGVADRAAGRPVDKNTRFNIASTSKMFLAVAMLILVDEGRVSLDEKVVRYVPEFTMKDERHKDITVRMLFNHSSGLPGATNYATYGPDRGMQRLLLETMKDANLTHEPGTMPIYCDDGFTLGEIVVEKVTGQKYIDFLAERIFAPLGMKNTGVSVGEGCFENIAEYYDIKTGVKYPAEAEMAYAAGGLSSTAEDLCRFGASFSPNGPKILSEASLREIRKLQPTPFYHKLKNGQKLNAFGWDYSNIGEYRVKGFQVLGKAGNSISYSTNLQIVPDLGIAVAASISGLVSSESLTRPILDALMNDKKLSGPEKKPAQKPAEAQTVPEDLLRYSGFYANDMGLVKVEFAADKKGFGIYPVADNEKGRAEAPVIEYAYNGGSFHNFEKRSQCYFADIDGTAYIIAHENVNFGADAPRYQKLQEIKNPVSFKCDIKGRKWLMRNLRPDIQRSLIAVTVSNIYKCLPGYADFMGVKKIETPYHAGMAAESFRERSELSLFENKGETWIKCAFFLFSPAEGARKLIDGVNRVMIKAEGYNEWLRVEKGSVIKFKRPLYGRIALVNDDEVLYDSIVDSPEYFGPGREPGALPPESVYAPAGSFIFCAGKAGDLFRIDAR